MKTTATLIALIFEETAEHRKGSLCVSFLSAQVSGRPQSLCFPQHHDVSLHEANLARAFCQPERFRDDGDWVIVRARIGLSQPRCLAGVGSLRQLGSLT